MNPPELAPWLKHNKALLEKFMADNQLVDSEIRVSAQLPMVPANPNSFPRFSYNPSIIWTPEDKPKLLMTYRYHVTRSHTQIGIAELNEHGSANRTKPLTLYGDSIEDARLFRFGDDTWLSWVVSDWDGYVDPHCVMKFGKLSPEWDITNVIQPKYGRNDMSTMEKNWCFFGVNFHLLCIYQSHPEQIIVEFDTAGRVVEEHKCPGFTWLWGTPRGGSVHQVKDGLLRFFHSGLDNEEPPYRRRYYVGACLMENKPPFKVISVSKSPILRGSIEDDFTPEQRKACQHYKGRVVFPGTAAALDDGWLLAVGINDSAMGLVKVKDLKF
jgi:predicted GH43/DUF377 family glycosyl hydrolase